MKTYRHPLTAALFLSLALTASATTHYVNVNSTGAAPPFLDWSTAATNIQDAVDAALAGDEIVVTNGVYATGGRAVYGLMTNRVAVDKPLTLRSVNGPKFTIIRGYQVPGITNGDGAIRCVYLTNGASLSGFTLTNGATRDVYNYPNHPESSGGGLWCASATVVVSNCTVAGNSAGFRGGGVFGGTLYNCTLSGNSVTTPYVAFGGGAFQSTLNNCTLTGNSSVLDAGGASNSVLNNCVLRGNSAAENAGGAGQSTLINCTLAGNSAYFSGGAMYGTLKNCIIYFNSANEWPNYSSATLDHCCTTPLPVGLDNFTNAPLFVNQAAGNLRLQFNSPCINSGYNAYVPGPTDLDGLPRIVRGTVDIGAYEFQESASLLSYAWLQRYGLPTDGSVDFVDSDGDGMNNLREWRADTIPTNALSVLRMVTITNGTPGLRVTWQSVPTRNYWLDRASSLTSLPSFSIVASNIAGQLSTTTFADTNATGPSPFFYRVGVQP